jgi:large subunit ribosomal protein L7A
MLDELKTAPKVIGAKQVGRALRSGQARRVYLADNADPRVTEPIEALCGQSDIPVERVSTMSQLGSACGIAVGSAVAAIVE